MNIDLGAGRRIEGFRPGMDSRDTVTLVSPTRRYEVTLGAVLVQVPGLKLPVDDEQRHFVGAGHPRNPKGEWTEHGPGGTKSKSPLKALSTNRSPNGTRWQTMPDDYDSIKLGGHIKTKSGVSGKIIGTTSYGGGNNRYTIKDDKGKTHEVQQVDALQYAPPPPPLTPEQAAVKRRGPRPKRARTPASQVGGNGVAPYTMDGLHPLQPGEAQVHDVFNRHREFLPNVDKLAFPAVLNREQMIKADRGMAQRGDSEPAYGLAMRPFYPEPQTMVAINQSTVDEVHALAHGQRTGFKTINDARTQAESTTAHELGHAIDFHLSGDERREVFDTLASELDLPKPGGHSDAELDDWVSTHKQELANKVSIYGTTNARELLAEVWSEYSLSSKSKPPWPWVESVGNVMRKAAASK